MHQIEPYANWLKYYDSSEDTQSPFFGKDYNYDLYTETIYGYYIDPAWDSFGSETLYLKILYVDYPEGYVILEFIGEWNDAINNDIMLLKRDVIDVMIRNGINKYILIGENVLNFHASDDCYYQEWFDDVEEGWIVALNFRDHVLQEFSKNNIDYYLTYGGELNDSRWRTFNPNQLFLGIEDVISHRLA